MISLPSTMTHFLGLRRRLASDIRLNTSFKIQKYFLTFGEYKDIICVNLHTPNTT
uniref:Uncharacterized protein n=1 Tax=Lepeophtheirus salmonis TaxID=72036 RepID=A0A0K2VEM3_LEPSM